MMLGTFILFLYFLVAMGAYEGLGLTESSGKDKIPTFNRYFFAALWPYMFAAALVVLILKADSLPAPQEKAATIDFRNAATLGDERGGKVMQQRARSAALFRST